ncbi:MULTISPECIES: hypothetical protein [Cyanophyceae]|uniref:hypothetical protein n=1 Tax=Cyanophyceae TaxID=3028117 RepID=UPI0016893836|nr:hypothetical protein [Trichocoleus sp. FACHB-40]MBD2005291.1 hypothetical protein [Trichocoleus sp. FACHB-40]
MSQKILRIIIGTQPAAEVFATYRATHDFYREVQYREELKSYSEWYYMTAESNRKELQKMRGDINIFGWFNRRKR